MPGRHAKGLPLGMCDLARRRVTVKPGGGVPLHHHVAFSETVWPVKGTLGIERSREALHLTPGETTTITPNAVHHIVNNDGEDVEFAVEMTPASLGFEQSIYVINGLANDGRTDDKDFPIIMNLCLVGQMADICWP